MPKLLTDPREVLDLSTKLQDQSIIALDTEFIRETTFYPKVALIQVATRDSVWLIDPTVLEKNSMGPFLEVLKNPQILKVMHAAHADQECLFWKYGCLAEPVLDTAVAAGLCGMGDSIGLGKLLFDVMGISLPKGRARAKWLLRPLPGELLHYAEQDVAHLVRLGEQLKKELEKRARWQWALEESFIPPEAFELVPEEVAMKTYLGGQIDMHTYPVLVELIRWREGRAKSANLPRGWVADNDTLIGLSKAQPSRIEELKSFRGINAKEVDCSGRDILHAIETGRSKAKQGVTLPQRTRKRPDIDEHLTQFVRTFVSYLASKHEIALRYLINMNKAHLLASSPGIANWVDQGILSPRSAELVGKELQAFMEGRRGMVLRGGKLEVFEVQ